MRNCEIKIENGEATLLFNGLLSERDFNLFWKGATPENNDGSDSEMSETVQTINDAYLESVLEGRFSDFQIWGDDPSFALHIDPAKVPALVARLRRELPFKFQVEFTGKDVDDLLEKWIVCKWEAGEDYETRIGVTLRKNFAEMLLCEAYDSNGQLVDCHGACCYTFQNNESGIHADFAKEIFAQFPGLAQVAAEEDMTDNEFCQWFSDSINHKPGRELFGAEAFDAVLAIFREWETTRTSHTEAKGWTYWDGSNHHTILIEEGAANEPDVTELDSDDQVEILLQMPTCPANPGKGVTVESVDYRFSFDSWSHNPWHCLVEK